MFSGGFWRCCLNLLPLQTSDRTDFLYFCFVEERESLAIDHWQGDQTKTATELELRLENAKAYLLLQ